MTGHVLQFHILHHRSFDSFIIIIDILYFKLPVYHIHPSHWSLNRCIFIDCRPSAALCKIFALLYAIHQLKVTTTAPSPRRYYLDGGFMFGDTDMMVCVAGMTAIFENLSFYALKNKCAEKGSILSRLYSEQYTNLKHLCIASSALTACTYRKCCNPKYTALLACSWVDSENHFLTVYLEAD